MVRKQVEAAVWAWSRHSEGKAFNITIMLSRSVWSSHLELIRSFLHCPLCTFCLPPAIVHLICSSLKRWPTTSCISVFLCGSAEVLYRGSGLCTGERQLSTITVIVASLLLLITMRSNPASPRILFFCCFSKWQVLPMMDRSAIVRNTCSSP